MEINNKILALVVIIVFILIWYAYNANTEISRYKNIIDTYMENKEKNKEKKSSLKKVRFNLPE